MNNTATQTNHSVKKEVETGFVPIQISDRDFERLSGFVHTHYGIDLSQKRQLIAGRLTVTIKQLGYHNFSEFVDHLLLTRDQKEMTLLLDKLTTNYTFFMREQECLDVFRNRIIPDIVRKHKSDRTLAIWSAGCSSGEEPYNISMYLMDYLGEDAKNWDTRLLATDISSQALAAARKGVYHLPDTIPLDWRNRYFLPRKDGSYEVAPIIRNNVIFRSFNLMDPIKFQRKFDVIFCRNVMIYFDQPTKDALVRRFYDATLPGGYFLISCSENLGLDIPYHKVTTATFQK
jgi:chemotaxis protein methyltransferase CheR